MVEGIQIDWQQVASFFTAGALLLSGVWFVLKLAIDTRIAPQLERIRKDINGPMDRRIDAQISARIKPVQRKLNHIDEELARHLDGYQRTS